jgi:glycerol-3-phosphate acyltransferase PlsY
MNYLWALLIGYALGSVSFSVLVARFKGVDLFTEGSGNPGATNVKRTIGAFWGNTVFILDFLKGFGAVIISQQLLGGEGFNIDQLAVAGLVGAILGHSFSIFLKFKGGKGVATTMGGLLAIMPLVFMIGVAVWSIVFFLSRTVALASILFSLSLPISAFFIYPISDIRFILCAALSILIIIRHHSNIRRMLSGNENSFPTK